MFKIPKWEDDVPNIKVEFGKVTKVYYGQRMCFSLKLYDFSHFHVRSAIKYKLK